MHPLISFSPLGFSLFLLIKGVDYCHWHSTLIGIVGYHSPLMLESKWNYLDENYAIIVAIEDI